MRQHKEPTELQEPNGKNSGQIFAPRPMKTSQHDKQK
jgi:hypothetical protein